MIARREKCPRCSRRLSPSRYDTTFRFPDRSERLCSERITRQQIQARAEPFDAMNEECGVDTRAPRNRISDAMAAGFSLHCSISLMIIGTSTVIIEIQSSP